MRAAAASIVLLALPAVATAQPSTDDVLARYKTLTSVAPKRCGADSAPDTITVCASKLRESQKVPYIEELRAGDRPRLAYGEVPGRDPGPPCGPRGEGCYSGPGVAKAFKGLIERIRD